MSPKEPLLPGLGAQKSSHVVRLFCGQLLALALALLLVVGVLCATVVRASPAQADALADCQPVAGVEVTYTPPVVHPETAVHLTAESVGASPPLTYTWTFGDGTAPASGVSASAGLTTDHAYTATGVYTVALSLQNSCTALPLTATARLTVSPAPCVALTGLELAYTPTKVYTYTRAVFGGEIVTGSVPVTYSWAFGDGADSITGTATTPVFTAAHTFTAARAYTVSLDAWNRCTVTPAQRTLRLVVSPTPFVSRVLLPIALRQVPEPSAAHLGYGANVASADHAISLTVMGFDWAKGFVKWGEAGKGPGYNWAAVDNQLREFVPHVQHILLRIGGPTPPGIGDPPLSAGDLSAFRAFAQALAAHVSATWRAQGLETAAYEIWNEPNLDYEWGGHPDAAQYTALLKAAYEGIKAGDPQAIVVSAGLATTGGSMQELALARRMYNAVLVVPDLTFLRTMYQSGAKGYLDALGSHPYGGRDAPDTSPAEASGPIYFRRAEEQHEVMLAYGDDSPVWATEFGWVLETDCNLGEHEWMEVDEAHQAEYLAAAYAYADENWPWMGPMLLFNLDFATCTWYDRCDPMRWYSITYREDPYDPGNSPIRARQAFDLLRDMAKRSAW